MNVVFLDFDGVVNIPIWHNDNLRGMICDYNHPDDECVNHLQAVQWVSEFCEKHDYSIVVSSTWRMYDWDCEDILRNSGLREDVKVIGVTPVFNGKSRGAEITAWLIEHPEVDNYLIFDDENDVEEHGNRLVECNGYSGFMLPEYYIARSRHFYFINSHEVDE